MFLVERVESYEEVYDFVSKAFKFFKPKLENAVIKPNFLKFDDPANGCITHPRVVEAVVDYVSRYSDCVVAEGGFYKNSADKCFDAFGLREKVRCVNLNRDEFVNINVDGEVLKNVKVAKTSLEIVNGATFISLPKLKVHHLTRVTLGIKNNIGFLRKPAIYMHPNIHRKLVDLLNVFHPDLVIIDGVIGGENSESRTKPVNHRVMIASDNVVIADIVGATLMGFDWREIGHLRLAASKFVDAEKLNSALTELEKLHGFRRGYSLSFFSRFLGEIGI